MTREEPAPRVHLEAALGRIHLSDFSVGADVRVPEHAHDGTHLCAVLEGGFEEAERRSARWCEPMSLRLSPADDVHGVRIGNRRMRCVVIGMSGPDVPFPASRVYARDAGMNHIVSRIRTVFAEREAGSPLVAESLTLELFAQMTRLSVGATRGPRPHWLKTIVEMLHDRPHRAPTLADLSAAVDRHPVHITRVFREHLGSSVGTYSLRLQLEMARQQIVASDESIASIAFAAGFADQSHMTRLMRRTIGITPGRLRNDARRAMVNSTGVSPSDVQASL